MKVAYCLSGHMRSYEKCLQNQKKNFIEKNNCDVFIYTSDLNTTPHNKMKNPNFKKEQVDLKNVIVNDIYQSKHYWCTYKLKKDELLNKVINTYRTYNIDIKDIFVEEEEEKENITKHKEVVKTWSWIRERQVRKFYMCNELLKDYQKNNSTSYDIVVRSRPDIIFKQPIDVEAVMKKNGIGKKEIKNTIFVWGGWPPGGDTMTKAGMREYLFDGFAFSEPEVMDIYCNLYNQVAPPRPDTIPNLEFQMQHYLLKSGINIKYILPETHSGRVTKKIRDAYCYKIKR